MEGHSATLKDAEISKIVTRCDEGTGKKKEKICQVQHGNKRLTQKF